MENCNITFYCPNYRLQKLSKNDIVKIGNILLRRKVYKSKLSGDYKTLGKG